jgi:hypothetical protein
VKHWLLITALSLSLPATASAREPATAAADCDKIVLSTGATPLRELLQKMASSLHFDLHYGTQDNPAVAMGGQHTAVALMERLAAHANMAVKYREDPRCPGQLKIAAVWVLPGQALASAPSRPAPLALAPAADASGSAPAREPGPADAYLRAHGRLPAH